MGGRAGSRRGGVGWAFDLVGSSFLILSAVLALHLSSVRAQGLASDAKGQRLAETWCSGCHQVKALPSGGSDVISSDAGPPSFPSIARMPSTTALSLRVFLRTPHPPMPDFRLTEPEIADVSAFILTLREQAPQR